MAFYWRGNQLFIKKGPTGEKDKGWTTFLMDLREPMEVNIYLFAFTFVKNNAPYHYSTVLTFVCAFFSCQMLKGSHGSWPIHW